jgi:hypothetical protein
MKNKCGLFVLLVLVFAISASATPYKFDFTLNSNQYGTAPTDFFSDPSGLKVTITAWSVVNNSFAQANLGQYSGYGLGVCNGLEGGSGCDSPQHMVDNFGEYDFVLFKFSSPVNPVSVKLSGFNFDTDLSYWTGTSEISNATLLSSLSFMNISGYERSGEFTYLLDKDSGVGNYLLVGTAYSASDRDDRFKIKGMSVETSPVPEPSTCLLLGSGLVALCFGMRRRNRS